MKQLLPLSLIIAVIGCSSPSMKKSDALVTHMDSVSYSVGLDMASRLEAQFQDINPDIMVQGILDYYNPQKSPLLTQEEKLAVIRKYTQVTQVEKQNQLSADNIANGEAFLSENLKNPGVLEGKDGLQYKIIKEGNGKKPHFRDNVKVHYEGRLIDGTIFDSSYERGTPAVFELGNVIPGFSEGILLMKEGAVFELYIPGKMAYGPRGGPGGPNALLIFKVELLEVLELVKTESK